MMCFDNAFIHSSVMFRRGLGSYDESIRIGEDYELWSQMIARTGCWNLPDELVDYRFHPGSVSMRLQGEMVGNGARVVAENLTRCAKGFSAEWPHLLASLWGRCGRPLEAIDALLSITSECINATPEVANEIQSLLSLKLCNLAKGALLSDRRVALKALLYALQASTHTALAYWAQSINISKLSRLTRTFVPSVSPAGNRTTVQT
jgi:hypothetical protein